MVQVRDIELAKEIETSQKTPHRVWSQQRVYRIHFNLH